MPLSWDEIQANAVAFSKRWTKPLKERQEAQEFTRGLVGVFGVDIPAIMEQQGCSPFEYPVKISGQGHDKYIDFLWKGKFAIEMKSDGKDLANAATSQLYAYMSNLPDEADVPDLWLVCDGANLRLTRRTTKDIWNFKIKDLRKHIKKFADIAGYTTERIHDNQIEVNVKAAEKMARLHDALKNHGYDGHDLEVYLVRLLFCLFADDTGIFPKDSFSNYIENSKEDGGDLSDRVARLFEVLNMPEEIRAKRTLLSDELKQFRYINGGLFAELLPSAEFDGKMRRTLVDCCNFDWNKISPAIFGAMFQGVMNPQQRREMGAHYTSEENILKLINPLFLDELWKEFDRVKTDPIALERFHDKIAKLRFLDPACGCGNFLIITYRELRSLELAILTMQKGDNQLILDVSQLLKVSVEQFYGIEYEDFPCQIAQVGMWLVDHQMNMRVSEQFGTYYARLPLTQSATIVNGNALRIDWESVAPKRELSFILGNPPFLGYSNQSAEQKEDIMQVCGLGKVDYVSAWYFKAANYIQGTQIRCAFVSTNSITQGEQVAAIWKPLTEQGIYINFGISTFKWSNEAKGKAAVHCVIIGFSLQKTEPNISPYLIEAPTVFVESRSNPICESPNVVWGNKPVDGGFLMLTATERKELFEKEPAAIPYVKKIYGAEEFINNIERYCLWLQGVNPAELRKMPLVMQRIENVKNFRLASTKAATQKAAEFPTRFMEVRQPDSDYILIPSVSSETRRYIPIGFATSDVIVNNAVHIIPNATLYHFGILTSNVHMAWVRAVCGRLKSDYRYSKDIVYNNFPWPDATGEQRAAIEALAQAILDARGVFPDSSLADLYDPLTMPPELRKAHQANDKTVMKLYGFTPQNTPTEAACVAGLMERYRALAED